MRLPDPIDGKDVALYLHTSDAGDGKEGDVAIWGSPEIVHPNRPPVSLVDAAALVRRVDEVMAAELGRTSAYLEVLAESHLSKVPVHEIAQRDGLDANIAARWASLVQLGRSVLPKPEGHYTERHVNVAGNPDVRGWGSAQTPSLTANASEQAAIFSTLTIPARGVIMHPSPTKEAIVYWRSPFAGKIGISGLVADADGNCGNGVGWRVDLANRAGIATLASGAIDNGARESFDPKTDSTVRPGDLVKFAISPRNRDHVCDSTAVGLTIREVGGKQRSWDLGEQVVDRLHDGNPLADTFGNADVWHFCNSETEGAPKNLVPAGSALANWRAAVIEAKPAAELVTGAGQVQAVLLASGAAADADKALRATLLDWSGTMEWGKGAPGIKAVAADIRAEAPSVLTFRIPAALAAGAELVTRASLHPQDGKEGSVQMRVRFTPPARSAGSPPPARSSPPAVRDCGAMASCRSNPRRRSSSTTAAKRGAGSPPTSMRSGSYSRQRSVTPRLSR